MTKKLYHYVLSGLDNIYLLNGYTIHNTPYGKGVSITEADKLHKAIARDILNSSRRLQPKEFRFLRKEMKCSQSSFGLLFGMSEQTIARVEKGETQADIPFESAFRAYANEVILNEKVEFKTLINEINKIEDNLYKERRMVLENKEDKWLASVEKRKIA